MPQQDVILEFPRPVEADDQLETKLNACLLVSTIAEMLYQARSYWIGGDTLPWRELTAQQKYAYRLEVEALIKGDE